MKYEIINMGETRMKVTSCRFLYHVYSEISTSNKSDLYIREIEATSHGICHILKYRLQERSECFLRHLPCYDLSNT